MLLLGFVLAFPVTSQLVGGLRGHSPVLCWILPGFSTSSPLPQSSPQKAAGPPLGHCQHPATEELWAAGEGQGREQHLHAGSDEVMGTSAQGWLGTKGDGVAGQWVACLVLGLLQHGALWPFPVQYPLSSSSKLALGPSSSPVLKRSRSYLRAPLHGYQSVGAERVQSPSQNSPRLCPPLPWSEVGFTHTNDLVPPKTCCLESWPDSILTCSFFFQLWFFCFSFLHFFLEWDFLLLFSPLTSPFLSLCQPPSMPSPPHPFPQRKGGWVKTLSTQTVWQLGHSPVGEAEPDSAYARLFLSTDPQSSHLRRSIG